MSVRMRPMNGFVVVSKDPLPNKAGEIVLPEQNSMRPVSGRVLIPSPSLANDYPEGTRVLFGKHAGETFKVEEQVVTLLHSSEIQAWISAHIEVETA